MSHPAQMEFFGIVFDCILPKDNAKIRVIDFGSLEINGGPHQLLDSVNREYIGVDLAEGKNVDLVMPGELVDLPSASFDIAMSSELFEHTPMWREIFYNMCRLTQPGGIVVLSCAGRHRLEHGTSRSDNGYAAPFLVREGIEYYGNVTSKDFSNSIKFDNWFDSYGLFENTKSFDTYFVGIRKGAGEETQKNFDILIDSLRNRYRHGFYNSESKYLIFKKIIPALRVYAHRILKELKLR
jgi:SAM-dependent methyltransferase